MSRRWRFGRLRAGAGARNDWTMSWHICLGCIAWRGRLRLVEQAGGRGEEMHEGDPALDEG